ncbi:DNA phosphorothioation system sulfurtransferase DndC [Amphritea pacifica]|uniref:DNA phosphorothioation system sulfurtransferase DndC n=1 Tax=Amphritea pacifica TaxID=2811233 RepID=UPI0019647829|nr:DNA phosphorothioation system sulfurtransferase DndC [Amphritea pacifica]MBN1006733.1 DNA phosphorothioation system sulfurtransferase DndC [Amphritea pacifica]
MASSNAKERKTAFKEKGFQETIAETIKQTQDLYLSDEIPWVIGYSGGKDSTATLQLVWNALLGLKSSQWHKPVHVISTDTLVENPIVALWVENSLSKMKSVVDAEQEGFPIRPHRLAPELQDRFWVNLLGRGYPAPRPKFRWCTSRLKINPSNNFINNVVKQNGEAILVLGTRKAESSLRSANMSKYQEKSTRELLSSNKDLDRAWVYTPIAAWQNDDVWQYLTQVKNPWGYRNTDLLSMYSGATEDGECPLVVDTSTPSCGDSRFGCFVCTMVDEDKSMKAMIQNDDEKEWMLPILDFRNQWLSIKNEKREDRDFRRMNGALTFYKDKLVHGPYRQQHRENMLAALLEAQEAVIDLAPEEAKNFRLIELDELEEIRRIWVAEKHEIEDSLPKIYQEATGSPYPGKAIDERQSFKVEDLKLLQDLCKEEGDDEGVLYQLTRELLHIEHQNRAMVRRSKLFNEMRDALNKAAFITESQAEDYARRRKNAIDSLDSDSLDSRIFATDREQDELFEEAKS